MEMTIRRFNLLKFIEGKNSRPLIRMASTSETKSTTIVISIRFPVYSLIHHNTFVTFTFFLRSVLHTSAAWHIDCCYAYWYKLYYAFVCLCVLAIAFTQSSSSLPYILRPIHMLLMSTMIFICTFLLRRYDFLSEICLHINAFSAKLEVREHTNSESHLRHSNRSQSPW